MCYKSIRYSGQFSLRLFSIFACLLGLFVCAEGQSGFVIRVAKTAYAFHGLQLRATNQSNHPKIGLALSGGGARGLAQIGVLRVIEKYHVPVDFIVGNSMGAVIGGLYASGYTTTQIESIALKTNWDDVLSFSEDTKRTDLFVGEKQADQSGFLVIRFDGLQPIIPSSVSSGQRLTNYFMNLTLQALYQPHPGFDDLKIPFRAVATDLLSGRRVILDHGSLAEAMRASATVPLLYSSLQKDTMALVDGGLLSNIPVDLARSNGCDIVIAVNCTSVLRREDQMNKPWEVADQVMSIMMEAPNKDQLKMADVVITPQVGDRIVSNFSNIASLISAGECATENSVKEILQRIQSSDDSLSLIPNKVLNDVGVEFRGDSIPATIKDEITENFKNNTISTRQIRESVKRIYETGLFQDVFAEITEHASPSKVIYHAVSNPTIDAVHFSGNQLLPDNVIALHIDSLKGETSSCFVIQHELERVVQLYRDKHYSLARIESVRVDSAKNSLNVLIDEGTVDGLYFEGNERTRDYVIRREFPLDRGDVFNLDEAYKGLVNIWSTGLFESVLLEVRYKNRKPILVLKVKEKSAELLKLGLHADNEHSLVGTIDMREANFRGAGENLGMMFRYGYRDQDIEAGYRANRIFQTYLTFNLKGYYRSRNISTYYDSVLDAAHWDIFEIGEYKEIKYGGSFTFGTQLERLGDFTAELRFEHHHTSQLSGINPGRQDFRFVGLRIQTTVDTEDKFLFPTDGVVLSMAFETAMKQLGSEVSFDKIDLMYESYNTIWGRHTLHPRIMFGFADQTLPITEEYSLGGLNSFFGLRENDSRGRQIFLINMEYRYWLPFKLIFETYFKVRYDLGTISDKPQELTLNSFHHGIGTEIALDTPLGSAAVGAGKSFYYRMDLLNSPPSVGPFLFYFSLGHEL